MEETHLSYLADILGCKVRTVPAVYLGLPLCGGSVPKTSWNPIVERVERKLWVWKAKYLSMGEGHSYPSSSSQFLSLLHVPIQMYAVGGESVGKITKGFPLAKKRRRNFIFEIGSPFANQRRGGLGIKPLKLVNKALLGKWLWRLVEEGDSLLVEGSSC